MDKTYSIAFKELGFGAHHFDFEVGDALFEEFDGSGIKGGQADVSVDLIRKASMLEVEMRIAGNVVVECDRCLEDCSLPVSYHGKFVVKFSDEPAEDDGDIMWLPTGQTELDLARYIYESIVLSLPYRRVHPSDVHGRPLCNPAMLERFKIVSEQEFEQMTSEASRRLGDDPQWDKLKSLKDID